MDINRIDVCHETIVEDTDESFIISIEDIGNDEAQTRVHLNYNENQSNLVELCVMEMQSNKKFKKFLFKIVDLYYEQDL
tara:strand:+ start:3274 stop:3510 length:237 start_codon:yes stop_codon:yes gene_type:complete